MFVCAYIYKSNCLCICIYSNVLYLFYVFVCTHKRDVGLSQIRHIDRYSHTNTYEYNVSFSLNILTETHICTHKYVHKRILKSIHLLALIIGINNKIPLYTHRNVLI